MDCRLVLTTLSGRAIEAPRFEEVEENVVQEEIGFVHSAKQSYLENDIWAALQDHKHHTIVFRNCMEALHTQEIFEGPHQNLPKAVTVPANRSGLIPSGAFAGVPRMRHVQVEAGICAVGARVAELSPPSHR